MHYTEISGKLPIAISVALIVLMTGCTERAELTDGEKGAPACIILVTIDTLRADHLPTYGYPRPTAPFLDRLAREGVVFENAFAPGSHTAPSHASIFTALFPSQHGVRRNGEALGETLPTIAATLRDAGFATGAVSGVGWLRQLGWGFDSFQTTDTAYGDASRIVGRALSWLGETPPTQPKFLWMHFFDVHEFDGVPEGSSSQTVDLGVYTSSSEKLEREATGSPPLAKILEQQGVPASLVERLGERLVASVGNYDARIRYVDTQLERFDAALSQYCAPAGTSWFVTSDHGEGLFTAARVGHGRYLRREQLHVPLILFTPEESLEPRRISRLVRLVDLAPTIAEQAGVPWTAGEGHSLLGMARGQDANYPVTRNFAQRRPASKKRLETGWEPGEVFVLHDLQKKYVGRTEAGDLFFDLKKNPFEFRGQVRPGDKTAASWQQLASKEWSRVAASSDPNSTHPSISDHQREQLRALGYAD